MIQIFSRQKMSLWIWYNSDDEILQDSLKVIDIPKNDRLFYLSVEDPWVISNSHPLLGGKYQWHIKFSICLAYFDTVIQTEC